MKIVSWAQTHLDVFYNYMYIYIYIYIVNDVASPTNSSRGSNSTSVVKSIENIVNY